MTKNKGQPRISRLIFILVLTLGFVSINPQSAHAGSCGDLLVAGSNWLGGNGVNVYSNGSGSCNGGSAGYGWQCVDLAYRLYQQMGWGRVYAANNNAYQIPEGSPGLLFYGNGSYTPVPGDLIIEYGTSYNSYGHVTVVNTVDLGAGVIHAIEQNTQYYSGGWRDHPFHDYPINFSRVITGGYGSVRGTVHSPSNGFTNTTTAKPKPRVHDYNVDSHSDLGLYNPETGQWSIRDAGSYVQNGIAHGGPGWTPYTGDFNGDGRSDLALYSQSTGWWSIRDTGTYVDNHVQHGGPGWAPYVGDFNGDGRSDLALYNQASGWWSIRDTATYVQNDINHGGPGWVPYIGDFNGDGKSDLGLYNRNTGWWSIRDTGTYVDNHVQHGGPDWTPYIGDFNGDGRSDLALYNTNNGQWSIRDTGSYVQNGIVHGGPGWTPYIGDYNGDGKSDLGLYNPVTGWWSIRDVGTYVDNHIQHGGSGWVLPS